LSKWRIYLYAYILSLTTNSTMFKIHKSILLPGLAVFLLSFSTLSCYEESNIDEPDLPSAQASIRIDTVVSGLSVPWGMAFLPNGDMLITERSGEIRIVRDGQLLEKKVEGLPEIYVRGQGGLMDITLHPDYEENGWIYISYAAPAKSGNGGNTAIMRARLENNTLVDKEELFKATPNSSGGRHFGSRIEFDREGFLYFSVGERGKSSNAQTLSNHSGKIFRLHDDGRVPQDNPFVNQKNAMPEIFTYGNRNPQGLALHPETGELWAHEHGPQGGDELNIIRKGNNYGWPEITYGINYDGSIITEDTAKAGMEQPVVYWKPSIAPCGMTFVTGDVYPAWKGDILVGSLKFQYLVRCELEGNNVVHQEKLLEGAGRVRNVKQGPDGYIYVALEGTGIVKLVPSDT